MCFLCRTAGDLGNINENQTIDWNFITIESKG